jgi:magnesium transporter
MPTTILTHGRVTWTNIVAPSREDVAELSVRNPQFHPLNLNDCLTDLEFPKMDHHDDYLFLVVQMPYWDANEKISRSAEVDIFIARGNLVTSHQNELKPLVHLFEKAQNDETARERLMGRGASPLLYEILDTLVDYCYPIMHKVNQNLRHIERNLFKEETQHMLKDVAIVRRDVISLRHILRPQLDIVRELERGNYAFIHDDLNLYWSDIGDHMMQLRSMLDEYYEVICGLSDTIDTLASHRIDEVVRLLTLITILTVPLTLLATIFGMNTWLPGSEDPIPFFAINGLGIVLTFLLTRYLHRRGWL